MNRLVIGPSVSVELKAPLRTGAGYVRWGNREGMEIVDEVPPGAYFAANSILHVTEVVLTVRLRPDVDRPDGDVPSVKHAYVVTRKSFEHAFPNSELVSWEDARRSEQKEVKAS